MSVRRIMGTETEYAVSGAQGGNPVQWSFDVVAGASSPRTRHIRWDYRQEDPVNDMRGMRLDRASARADMLTDEPQPHVTNVIAPNGGRIYVDHAHPEYSAPETDDPFTAVIYDTAGDVLMEQAKQGLNRIVTCVETLEHLEKNGTDDFSDADKEELKGLDKYRDMFIEAMDDDLNTADAISAIFEMVSDINVYVRNGASKIFAKEGIAHIKELTEKHA